MKIAAKVCVCTFLSVGYCFAQTLPRLPDRIMPYQLRTEGMKLPAQSAYQLSIPEISDRRSETDDSARLRVVAFKLRGAVDRPDLNISIADIHTILHKAKTAPGRIQEFTISELQTLADKITQYYRHRGMILARAYIPAQDVNDGIVVIGILEGYLAQVLPQDNKVFSNDVLTIPFVQLKGEPIVKTRIESALVDVNDFPGLDVFAVLQPGDEVGTSQLVLKVQKEHKGRFAAHLDNHGNPFSGEYRLYLDGSLYNLTQGADELSATIMHTIKPAESMYGSITYERGLFIPKIKLLAMTRWGVSLAYNRYEVMGALSPLGLKGSTQVTNFYIKKALWRGRERNAVIRFSLATKGADVIKLGSNFSNDQLTILGVELNVDFLDRFNGLNEFGVSFYRGIGGFLGSLQANHDEKASRFNESFQKAGGEFNKLVLSYNRLQHLGSLHPILGDNSLLLRYSGQYSNRELLSMEQKAMGGPTNVRAYPSSEFLRDNGYFFSVDLLLDAPGFADHPAFWGKTWSELLQFSLFGDWTRGWNHNATDNDLVELSGIGAGVRFQVPKKFSSRMTIASRTTNNVPSNNREPQVFFDLTYQFY